MKKNMKKSVLAFLIFVIVFLFGLNFFSKLMVPKDGEIAPAINGLYQQKKDSIDVLVLGDSSIYRSVNPALIWEENKLTSYVIGAPSARIYTLYYLLEEALKKQTPKLVVIESNCVFNNHEYTEGNKRKVIDNMKLSKNKINMINDDVFNFTSEQKLKMLFPISLYHNRYNDITIQDVKKTLFGYGSKFNGFVMSDKIKPYLGDLDYMKKDTEDKLGNTERKYLSKIESLCKSHNIPLLYLKVPGAREWNKTKNELMTTYAQEKNISYLDLNLNMKNPINWSMDTLDKGVHLNTQGAIKTTKELNEYIRKHYHFDKINHDNEKDKYDEMLRKYRQKLNKKHSSI